MLRLFGTNTLYFNRARAVNGEQRHDERASTMKRTWKYTVGAGLLAVTGTLAGCATTSELSTASNCSGAFVEPSTRTAARENSERQQVKTSNKMSAEEHDKLLEEYQRLKRRF